MSWWPRRFKGMIRPNMGSGFGDSRKIADRMSVPFVCYLRARRAVSDPAYLMFRDMHLQAKRDFRAAHFRLKRRPDDNAPASQLRHDVAG